MKCKKKRTKEESVIEPQSKGIFKYNYLKGKGGWFEMFVQLFNYLYYLYVLEHILNVIKKVHLEC